MPETTLYQPLESPLKPERETFERLMGESQSRARSMALQLTRNPNEADDLLQETWTKAWRGFSSYVPGRPFLNWVLRIMQRAYLDSRRRANPIRKAESLSSIVSPSEGDVQEVQVADTSAGPDEAIFRKLLKEELHTSLEQLPPVYRSALVLCDLEGLTYAEIADEQKTTVGTVRSRIHRGRKLLRDILIRNAGSIANTYA